MPWVGFEFTISAGELPKTYALDRAATGTGNTTELPHSNSYFYINKYYSGLFTSMLTEILCVINTEWPFSYSSLLSWSATTDLQLHWQQRSGRAIVMSDLEASVSSCP